MHVHITHHQEEIYLFIYLLFYLIIKIYLFVCLSCMKQTHYITVLSTNVMSESLKEALCIQTLSVLSNVEFKK